MTPRRAVTGGPAGFTLVEVLVALLAMSVMAGMAWRGIDGIVRTRDASQARLEQTLRLNTVVAQWEEDLRAVQDSSALPQALSCDGASVRLARRTPTGLQVVAWSLRPDADGNAAWVRWASPPVTTRDGLRDSWQRSLQLQGGEAGSLRALAGLAQWQVYFYQGNGWANCQSTGNFTTTTTTTPTQVSAVPSSPPGSGASSPTGGGSGSAGNTPFNATTTRQALPTGVRLLLTFAPGSGVAGNLTRDIALGP